jgi:organic hydroperoxide reductase OsmC/OhrA
MDTIKPLSAATATAQLESLAREAQEKICPDSRATRNNVPVDFEFVGA